MCFSLNKLLPSCMQTLLNLLRHREACGQQLPRTAFPAETQARRNEMKCLDCCMPACKLCSQRPAAPLRNDEGWDDNGRYTCATCRNTYYNCTVGLKRKVIPVFLVSSNTTWYFCCGSAQKQVSLGKDEHLSHVCKSFFIFLSYTDAL